VANENVIESINGESSPVPILLGELGKALTDLTVWRQAAESGDDTRFCRWEGQSEDGRKHREDLGKEPLPWEGSSDTRVRLVDSIVNERVMESVVSFFDARPQVIPHRAAGEASRGVAATSLLRWMLFTHMQAELVAEIDLASQWREQYGLALMGVFWKQETQLRMQAVSLEGLRQMAQVDEALARMLEVFFDPTADEALVEFVQEMAQGLSKGQARKILSDLRETGAAEVPVPVVISSRPCWQALMPYYDVIFPASTYDIQRARFVARRELVTETELRERVETEGYSEEFVEEALKHKGSVLNGRDGTRMQVVAAAYRSVTEEERDLIELWHTYSKSPSAQNVPQVWCSVIHGAVPELAAKHSLSPYDHGLIPFVPLVRERVKRRLIESRGVPEITFSQQNDIKRARDFRNDRADIEILPPFRVPLNRGKMQILMGPNMQLPARRADEFGFIQMPQTSGGSLEVEKATRNDVDEYWGVSTNWSPNMPKDRQQLHRRYRVGKWLREMELCVGMTWMLMQQYMSAEEVQRVVQTLSVPLARGPIDIRGQYDVMVVFDVRNLDVDYVSAKLEALTKIASLDVAGVMDRAKLIKILVGAVDPVLADDLVKDAEAASQQEVEDEENQFTKIAAGVEPMFKDGGQNAQLRLQVLQQIVQKNPQLQQRLQQDGVFRAMVENRMKHFQFQLEQQQNAQIGRMGVKPVL
jgi:hypothetical protein